MSALEYIAAFAVATLLILAGAATVAYLPHIWAVGSFTIAIGVLIFFFVGIQFAEDIGWSP